MKAFVVAEEAISFYRENFETVDLVLLDMIMPRMDGQQTFAFLK